MESFTGFGHTELSPWLLLTASAAYSAALIILGMFFAFRKKIRGLAFWIAFGAVTWIPVLLGGGQHLPFLDQFTSDQYCFGEPGVEVFVALVLPPLAVFWVAWGTRRDETLSPETVVSLGGWSGFQRAAQIFGKPFGRRGRVETAEPLPLGRPESEMAEHEFAFRLRFNLLAEDYIDHSDEELTICEDRAGFSLRLKSGERGAAIKQRSRAALIGGPYPTEEAAGHAASIAKRALLVWAVTQRRGIDLGDGRRRGGLTAYGRELLESAHGGSFRDDIHGVDVYPRQDDLAFVSVNMSASIGMNAANFAQRVSTEFLKPRALSEKQIVASELYCSSYFDVSVRSRFITLVTAIEALLETRQRAPAALTLVEQLNEIVAAADLDEATRSAIRGSLEWLRYDSIGQAGRALAEDLLPGREYAGQSPAKFFQFCYNLRSEILHNGQIADASTDLAEVANTLTSYVAELLLASFATVSSSAA